METMILESATCQVCGKHYQAANGVIAHHGYQRPGDGWQTSSCAGARVEPFEVSKDRLVKTISSVIFLIESKEATLQEWTSCPPAVIARSEQRSVYSAPVEKTYNRPEDFRPGYGSSIPNTYANAYRDITSDLEHTIKAAKGQLEYMQQRESSWVKVAEAVVTIPGEKPAPAPRVKKAPKPLKKYIGYVKGHPEVPTLEMEVTSNYKAKEMYEEWLKANVTREEIRKYLWEISAREVKA